MMTQTLPSSDPFVDKVNSIRETIMDAFKGKKIFITSSFQTQSIPLLHIISLIDRSIPVYFLNTGYHFPETLSYKNMVRDMLGLNTIDLNSPISKNHQRDIKGNLLFTSDPDYCCHLNKVQPMEAVLIEYDVWISGVRSDQTANRKSFQTIDRGPFNILRYHPMLKWTAADISGYINKYQLPSHPLEKQGYTSMGCMPCTRKTMSSNMNNRDGRWVGLTKTECGLHTELVRK